MQSFGQRQPFSRRRSGQHQQQYRPQGRDDYSSTSSESSESENEVYNPRQTGSRSKRGGVGNDSTTSILKKLVQGLNVEDDDYTSRGRRQWGKTAQYGGYGSGVDEDEDSSRVKFGGFGGRSNRQRQQYSGMDEFDDDDEFASILKGGRSGRKTFGGYQSGADDDDEEDFGTSRGRWGRQSQSRGQNQFRGQNQYRGQNQQTQFRGQNQQGNQQMVEKENILNELIEDRCRDYHHAKLFRQLSEQRMQNMPVIICALQSGKKIPQSQLYKMLLRDFAFDRALQAIATNLMKDTLQNRNVDHIIHDLSKGVPHVPHRQQPLWQKENKKLDKVFTKIVSKLLSTNAPKRLIECGIVDDLICGGEGPQ